MEVLSLVRPGPIEEEVTQFMTAKFALRENTVLMTSCQFPLSVRRGIFVRNGPQYQLHVLKDTIGKFEKESKICFKSNFQSRRLLDRIRMYSRDFCRRCRFKRMQTVPTWVFLPDRWLKCTYKGFSVIDSYNIDTEISKILRKKTKFFYFRIRINIS